MPRDATAVREKILDAADQLFGERGFDGAATREIAERGEVSKALIHYHFAGKEGLFHAVLDRYYARLGELLASALGAEGTIRGRYEVLIDAYVDFLCDNQRFSRLIQREIAGGRHVEHIAAHMVLPFRGGVAVIEQTFPQARYGALAAPHVLVSFFGMIAAWFTYAPVVDKLLEHDSLAPESIAARKRHLRCMLELVTDALGAPAATEGGAR